MNKQAGAGVKVSAEHQSQTNPQVLEAAISWKSCLTSGLATPKQLADCQRWREENPEHEKVWQRLVAIEARFKSLPAGSHHVLARREPVSPRTVLKSLLVFAAATPVALTATDWGKDVLLRDYYTKTGQRKRVVLPDGTELNLNTDTAVDILFDDQYRRIVLHRGEITVNTAPDPAAVKRSLIVSTARGQVKALGTHFWIRDGKTTEVAVFDGATEVTHDHKGGVHLVEKGYQVSLNRQGVSALSSADVNVMGWTEGKIIAQSMPLGEFLAELERYYSGVIVCDEAVAGLKLSGVFPLDNKEHVLNAIEQSLPVRVDSFSRFWVRVAAR